MSLQSLISGHCDFCREKVRGEHLMTQKCVIGLQPKTNRSRRLARDVHIGFACIFRRRHFKHAMNKKNVAFQTSLIYLWILAQHVFDQNRNF
jgi:hypothetical protein